MKVETLYVAKDGKYFYTEEDCKLYEENLKTATLNKNLETATRKYDRACGEIQALKASWFGWDGPTEIRPETIEYCKTLPQIERVCRKAKEIYMHILQTPGHVDRAWKVEAIANAAGIYRQALQHRRALMSALESARIDRAAAEKRIQALVRAKNKHIPEAKPDIADKPKK